ncbi:FitA-like ribbon-helix-helix domain-containing protein [Synechococcus elongatus]|uniref:Panthotenate metabolism flavoprotein n=2 Tax=Synechococcus elongatus TaxID=32046 RepID=Q31MZ5_SYNE7|nr:pantothenate metabolism flavoprotein [Synechococcus elongatus]ABB57574.1 panthotenate metabolism flavoprotein [Synechococcus elongatus PCC 7942 = FACHB-805]AJD57918.1 plasmid stabilization protein [Synechococcus elongatus UTEX 2973]MBD2588375.1 pantothenate metabolism flavoprotein [Synechococcus elongatus FACHB-242]MBD2689462.1 pantothenate metabolism flavoprotein [Synechococcus elongatus FACHB-1061]MBD2708119.1 pantothenate metabolism flavoprotein [Synechococcus elongatus PCC 7942 = FACHB-
MASLTVRNLKESVKASLRLRAARNQRSLEEEVRIILEQAVEPEASEFGLGSRIHQRFLGLDADQMVLPDRPVVTPESCFAEDC